MRKNGCKNSKGKKCVWIIAFGIGLLVALVCPPKCLVAVLAGAVIVLGIAAYAS